MKSLLAVIDPVRLEAYGHVIAERLVNDGLSFSGVAAIGPTLGELERGRYDEDVVPIGRVAVHRPVRRQVDLVAAKANSRIARCPQRP